LLPGFIDPPSPWDSKKEWRAFLAELRTGFTPEQQEDPTVAALIAEAEKMVKEARD
jgi:hypothetical protein